MNLNKIFGSKGEESAASFLCGKGYSVIGRNIKLAHTETDIIAVNDRYIIFVEVKTRRAYPSYRYVGERPSQAVDHKKQLKLIEGAKRYLNKFESEYSHLQPRIDVIEVYASPDSEDYKVLKIHHIENAVTKYHK